MNAFWAGLLQRLGLRDRPVPEPQSDSPVDVNVPVVNPSLVEAIRTWTTHPTSGALSVVEQELRGATFLVATEIVRERASEGRGGLVLQAGATIKFHGHGSGDAPPRLALFTDWDAIRAWSPEPVDGMIMRLTDVVGLATAETWDGAIVNPGGDAFVLTADHLRGLAAAHSTGTTVAEIVADVPQGSRDAAWGERFERALEAATLFRGPQGVFTGPDGFRYLDLQTDATAGGDPVLFADAAAEGIAGCHGVTINASEAAADWVLSLGRLVDFGFNETLAADGLIGSASRVLSEPEQVLICQPDSKLFPSTVRTGFRVWLHQELGVSDVGVALIVNSRDRPPRSLVLDLRCVSPDQRALVRRAAVWFLPTIAPPATTTLDLEYAPL